ncbi:uncharacterized protein N7479_005104 [Penicillium vulpinum]|uniref:uncharacterized protein n=1 Tax=Penicillium vulpinum TaxID=29845 RepID=UPI0025492986|nr:uncharacterized protein N7479_005104 [Penicillium vulpinum]KAJ5965228.1 hypothetical protein N7479_005104 [Penicillium vulpinum]
MAMLLDWLYCGNGDSVLPIINQAAMAVLFVSFLFFWLLTLPALSFPINKVRYIFEVRTYFSPAYTIAFFG